MKLSLRVSAKWLDFLDGLTELNANDVMWQWLEVYLDTPLATRQSLWVTYTHKKYGEHTHEILFAEDGVGRVAKSHIPPEVIKIAGEWTLQIFIRQYTITDTSKYTQAGTNKVTFTVADGLPLDADDAPVNNETIASLYVAAKALIGAASAPFELNVLSTDNGWQLVNGKWVFKIMQTKHNFSKIHSLQVEGLQEDGAYENIVYAYKHYNTGNVSTIFDKKIDIKIIIKGEK